MRESVAVAKEADTKKKNSPTKCDKCIHRVQHERQLGSLKDVIGNIRRDGGSPSVDSIATELSSMHTAQRASVLLALQRTHGNQYVQRVVAGIQAKLKVGQPRDKYEQEADRVAEAVMRMAKPEVRRQIREEERKRKEEEQVQRLSEEKEMPVMTKNLSGETPQISDDLEERLSRTKGLGGPLPADTRTFMEERFGADFSAVGIHTDSETSRMARALNAEAFTYGRDIYFGAGKYSPRTFVGKRLLAHELTHVVQQTGISRYFQRKLTIGQPGDVYEQEADTIARMIVDGDIVNAHEINHRVQQNMFKLQLQGAGASHSDAFCPQNSAANASSTNFSLAEFKCRDGTDVPKKFRGTVQQLMNNLEVLRTELGNNSITINSGYRTPAYNKSIGGASRSRHMCGQAADIKVRNHTPKRVADTIEKLIKSRKMRQGGLGRYSSFVHYDVRGSRARW